MASAFPSHLAWCHFDTCLGDIYFVKDPAPCLNSAGLQEKCFQLQWELLPRKDRCYFIIQEPRVRLILGRTPQTSVGMHWGCVSDPVHWPVHSHSRVCLFELYILEHDASQSTCFSSSVFHILGVVCWGGKGIMVLTEISVLRCTFSALFWLLSLKEWLKYIFANLMGMSYASE